MSPESPEHFISIGSLEHEGFETGCVAAYCSTCNMWVGPHRDVEEEAEPDSKRHADAVRRQHQHASDHAAGVRYDQHEAEFMRGMIEDDPESDPVFGPYFAHCGDCAGDVGLGRTTEQDAQDDARQHCATFRLVASAEKL